MKQDDFYELAAAGAQVLGSPPGQPSKTGFFRRIFTEQIANRVVTTFK